MTSRFLAVFLIATVSGFAGADENKRLKESTATLSEILRAEDKAIPRELLEKAACVVVVPGLKKGGFIVAAQFGRGFATCRTKAGRWSAPYAMRMEGGSFGLQAGGAESDIVLVVMNEAGMQKLLKSKFTLGGEASIAGGPVGRDARAMTDAMMRAEILSYSRSRGVFGGLSLQGSTLRPDDEANVGLYGEEITGEKVLLGNVPTPSAGRQFTALLAKYTPRKGVVRDSQ